jgi:putative glutathione S-transferase
LEPVYAGIFKLGGGRLARHPHLAAWLRDVWQLQLGDGGGDGGGETAMQVRDTVDIDACRASYYTNLFPLNPGGIVPAGPRADELGLDAPAGRGPSGWRQACFLKEE